MTRDEIIEIAQQVTKEFDYLWCNNMPELERFADLVEQRANAWRPASEPPEDARQVLGRQKRGHCESVHFLNGSWFVEATGRHTLTITHWRDVTPPTEGK
mgnify:CR=1 FL=1